MSLNFKLYAMKWWGEKMALALAAEKNKHCCHTPRVMFCGSAFCAG